MIRSIFIYSVYILLFISILVASFITVLNLNPKVVERSNVLSQQNKYNVDLKSESGTVAGVFDEFSASSVTYHQIPILVDSLNRENVLVNKKTDGKYAVILNIDKMDKYFRILAFKIVNLNNIPVKTQINTKIVGEVSNYLKIDIQDKKDIIRLFSENTLYTQTISLNPKEERSFYMHISSVYPINFPFGIFLDIE